MMFSLFLLATRADLVAPHVLSHSPNEARRQDSSDDFAMDMDMDMDMPTDFDVAPFEEDSFDSPDPSFEDWSDEEEEDWGRRRKSLEGMPVYKIFRRIMARYSRLVGARVPCTKSIYCTKKQTQIENHAWKACARGTKTLGRNVKICAKAHDFVREEYVAAFDWMNQHAISECQRSKYCVAVRSKVKSAIKTFSTYGVSKYWLNPDNKVDDGTPSWKAAAKKALLASKLKSWGRRRIEEELVPMH